MTISVVVCRSFPSITVDQTTVSVDQAPTMACSISAMLWEYGQEAANYDGFQFIRPTTTSSRFLMRSVCACFSS